jgi:putative FmdB family regulatory protein
MPHYEFFCHDCKKLFSKILSLVDYENGRVVCPKCGSKKVEQRWSAFTVITSKKSGVNLRGVTYLLRRSLLRQGDSQAIAGCSWHASARRRNEMRSEDLRKPDRSSEIVLPGSGGPIFVSLLLIVAPVLIRA